MSRRSRWRFGVDSVALVSCGRSSRGRLPWRGRGRRGSDRHRRGRSHRGAGAGEVDAGATFEGAGIAAVAGTARPTPSPTCAAWARSSRRPKALPFLPGLGWSVHRRPTFDTIVAPHPSGAEVRLALWQNCLWEFELSYDALASNDRLSRRWNQTLQTLMGFYLARGGQRGTFLYIDPDFNAMVGQGIGAGDGVDRRLPVHARVRRPGRAGQLGDGGRCDLSRRRRAVRRAGRSAAATITFAAAPAERRRDLGRLLLRLHLPLPRGQLDFEEFMDNLWQLKSLKFRQVRL